MKVYYAKCKEGIEAPEGAYIMEEVILQRKPHIIHRGTELKHCSDCKEWLPLDSFYIDKTFWDGLHQHCNCCCIARAKAMYISLFKEGK